MAIKDRNTMVGKCWAKSNEKDPKCVREAAKSFFLMDSPLQSPTPLGLVNKRTFFAASIKLEEGNAKLIV